MLTSTCLSLIRIRVWSETLATIGTGLAMLKLTPNASSWTCPLHRGGSRARFFSSLEIRAWPLQESGCYHLSLLTILTYKSLQRLQYARKTNLPQWTSQLPLHEHQA